MPNTLHMQTEEARALAEQIRNAGQTITARVNTLLRLSQDSSIWSGVVADHFRSDSRASLRRLLDLAEQQEDLALALRTEIEQWEQVDTDGARLFHAMPAPVNPRPFIFPSFSDAEFRKQMQENWNRMTREQRERFLQDFYDDFLRRHGLPEKDLHFVDINDPRVAGSADRFTNEISIDVDFLNDPFETMDTVAHEGRHYLQAYYVDHPDQIPEGFDRSVIDGWRLNRIVYIPGIEIFNELYRNQPIEADAFAFAEEYIANYFTSEENYRNFMGNYANQAGA